MFSRCLSFVLLLLLFKVEPRAQQFGGNPPSLRFKQIESPHFRVIFPKGMGVAASRVASIGERVLKASASTIGDKKRKIDIVLQNQTMVSNGYVGLAPWRSEFFLTPLQNSLQLGSLNWLDMLALHEIRHVQQYANFRKGISKWAYLIAGEQGLALANSAAVPDWFYEGDAVFQETLLSHQGRGRLPSFLADYRAIQEAGFSYSYMTLRNGSLKRMIPDHYQTGYLLVAEGRKRFGPEVWKKITDKAVRYQPLFYPFQGAFQKVTGLPFRTFVKESLFQDSTLNNDASQTVSAVTKRFVTDYSFPLPAGKDSFIVLKQTDRDIPAFYWLINGQEKKIMNTDIRIDPAFSYRSGTIAFTSYTPDLRWGWRNYSDIVLVNLADGSRKRITEKGKYFAPDLSPDGTKIIAVHVDPSGKQSLHLLDARTGQLMFEYYDSAYVYSYPRFSAVDTKIHTLVRLPNGKMGIQEINLGSSSASFVLQPSWQPLAYLLAGVSGELYFTAAWHGRDRFMQLNPRQGQLWEHVANFTGVQQGSPLGTDSVFYTASSAWGNRLYTAAAAHRLIDKQEWERFVPTPLSEAAPLYLDTVKTDSFQERKYSASTRLINFHSWRPFYEQPEWSFTVYGQNILNTFQSAAFYLYNENEGYQQSGVDFSYGRWFPWITGGTSYTLGRNAVVNNKQVEWNEWNARAGVRVPINLTRGRTIQSFTLASLYNVQQVDYLNRPKSANIRMGYMDNVLNWAMYAQQARQQIFPRWGVALGARHRFSVSSREARQVLLSGNVFLPGILKTHNLVISASMQSRDTANQYLFSNSFPLSRGYPVVNLPRMWKVAFNYHLPLVYPDFGIGNIVYLLRVRGNLFYDYSEVKSLRTGRVWALPSAGTEVYFDTKWWNQQPVSFGVRYSRLLQRGPYTNAPSTNQVEFILPLNLLPD